MDGVDTCVPNGIFDDVHVLEVGIIAFTPDGDDDVFTQDDLCASNLF